MNEIWQILDSAPSVGSAFSPQNVLLSLVLAFVLGQVLAWVYYFTHHGLSYSRSFVQSLVLITVIVAIIMAVIGNNIITAFGLMGALAIIRFRNVIKDTRDIVFIFSALVVGMAAGSQRYSIAILGTILLGGISLYLHLTGFGTHQPHNGFLRFNLSGHMGPEHMALNILKRFCSSFTLISVHQSSHGDNEVEYSYQLMVRNAEKNANFLAELKKIKDVSNISLTMQEQLLEI